MERFLIKYKVAYKWLPAIRRLSLIIAGAVFIGTTFNASVIYADRFEQQMNKLRQQNKNAVIANRKLQTLEGSLDTKINNLQATISMLKKRIKSNQAKQGALKRKIVEANKEIAYQRKVLGINIKHMYFENQFSTIEKLATSRDLSHYVDKEQYRISVQTEIKLTLERIQKLKKQQEQQKVMVEKLLNDQQIMKADVTSEKAEAKRLLGLNRSQQLRYNRNIKLNNKRISELQRQQAEENARILREQQEAARRIAAERAASNRPEPASVAASSSVRWVNGRSYPWRFAPFPNSMPDPWGMYKRQCVSYTAWKVSASGRHMPYWGGRGNANLWDNNARAAGIPVSYNPRVGDVAVSNAGYYGHVMYVEAVHGDGTISISQYNAGWDGRYSEARIYPSGLVFIHF